MTTDNDLRDIGHNLCSLLAKCEAIGTHLNADREYNDRPHDPIHRGILEVLTLFATKLRYYNLNHLAGATAGQSDPIALWWDKVAAPICNRHYSERQKRLDEGDGALMHHLLGDDSLVRHSAENGGPIKDLASLFARGRATLVVQRYGRLYTLQIARWLTSMIFDLSHRGAYELRIQPLLGLNEPFTIFLNEDKYFRERKTWSIYPR